MSENKRRPYIAIITVLLIIAFIGGGGLGLWTSQIEIDRVQNEIKSLNATTSDLTSLGVLATIVGKGWNADGLGVEQFRTTLSQLREKECCTLESDFAVPALTMISHVQVVLAEEKSRVAGQVLVGDTPMAMQSALVSAYTRNEKLAQDVSQVFTSWAELMSKEQRETKIKSIEEATVVGQESFRSAQEQINQGIKQLRDQQDGVSQRIGESRLKQNTLQTQTFLLWIPVGLGFVLLIGVIIMSVKVRRMQRIDIVSGTAVKSPHSGSKKGMKRHPGKVGK